MPPAISARASRLLQGLQLAVEVEEFANVWQSRTSGSEGAMHSLVEQWRGRFPALDHDVR